MQLLSTVSRRAHVGHGHVLQVCRGSKVEQGNGQGYGEHGHHAPGDGRPPVLPAVAVLQKLGERVVVDLAVDVRRVQAVVRLVHVALERHAGPEKEDLSHSSRSYSTK